MKFFKANKNSGTQKLSIREIVEIYSVFKQLNFFLDRLETHSTSHFSIEQSEILERSIMVPLKEISEEVDEYRREVEMAVDMEAIQERVYRIKPEYEVIFEQMTNQRPGNSGMQEEYPSRSGENL